MKPQPQNRIQNALILAIAFCAWLLSGCIVLAVLFAPIGPH